MARKVLLSVTLLLFLQETRGDGKPSSCSIPPVEVGGTAILTCKFDTNIYETKESFQVERYSTTKNKQESLLACQWISEKLKCQLHASLRFDRNITNTFHVEIPFVTSDDFGEYVCYVLPTPNGISKRCYLTRIDNNVATIHLPLSVDTSVTTTPKTIRGPEKDNNVGTLHLPISVDTTVTTTPKTMRGPEKCRPLNRGGDNGVRDVYLFEKNENFLIHFELTGHPSPNISSIQVTGKSKKHYTLHEHDEWKQIVLPNEPESFITTIFLSIMKSPMNFFNYYEMNVSNSEGTTTLHFQIQSYGKTIKDSAGVAVILSSISVAAVCILIAMIIGGVVHARLKQKQDSSKPSGNVVHNENSLQQQGGVVQARLNQKQGSSKQYCRYKAFPHQSALYVNVPYDEPSLHQQGGVVHAPLKQKQDSSKPSPQCKYDMHEDLDYEEVSPQAQGGIVHAQHNQMQISTQLIPQPKSLYQNRDMHGDLDYKNVSPQAEGGIVHARHNQKQVSTQLIPQPKSLYQNHDMHGDLDYEDVSPQAEAEEIHDNGDQLYMDVKSQAIKNVAWEQQDESNQVSPYENYASSHHDI